jgi:predicted amidohydrolase YtcJ
MARGVLIRDAEVAGRRRDVRIRDGAIAEIRARLGRMAREAEIDARGGALVPGLHDHHLHLLSLAAALDSVRCGPPTTTTPNALAAALRAAQPAGGWLRGTGYFESVAGPLDRAALDALRADVPIRIQHRSGSMWMLNSRAVEALGLDAGDAPDGVERDERGRATGRVFRADAWLRGRLSSTTPPDLARVGAFLARCGVTRVTDAGPGNGPEEASLFAEAQRKGALPQRLRLMGDERLCSAHATDALEIAERKLLYDEHALPPLDDVVVRIREAHAAERRVAIHAVTRTELHFALAALRIAGARAGDRLEHASVAPPEAMAQVHALGLSIVTQPNFVAERGDAYRADVEAGDRPHLYRVRSWLDRGVPLAAGSDAPFGDPDPWRAMRAAVTRTSASGAMLGVDERVAPECAIRLFGDGFLRTTPRGALAPAISVGDAADLCLLDAPWQDVRLDLSRDHVVATLRDGQVVWSA